jgi:hypothetical protein
MLTSWFIIADREIDAPVIVLVMLSLFAPQVAFTFVCPPIDANCSETEEFLLEEKFLVAPYGPLPPEVVYEARACQETVVLLSA